MNSLVNSKRILVLLISLIILGFLAVTVYYLLNPPKPKISPLQITQIGKTTDQQINKLPNIAKRDVINKSVKEYLLNSQIPQLAGKIIVENGIVVYESIYLPEDPKAPGHANLDQFAKQYGQPEKVINGSAEYGPDLSTYIYSSKGFTLIANPNTKEVFKVEVFEPMSPETYLQKYGKNIVTKSGVGGGGEDPTKK